MLALRTTAGTSYLLLASLAVGCALQHDRDSADARADRGAPDASQDVRGDDHVEVDAPTDAPDADVPPPDACGARPELCNGVDDNCNGMVDETFACVHGSPPRACPTACGTTGTQTCSETCTLSSCAPPAEACNGVDDDCNGMVDETFACAHGSPPRACTTACGTAGTQTCSDACALSACAPPQEACNGVDDDCNGACDDGVPGCRAGVYRLYSSVTADWYYTLNPSELSGDPTWILNPPTPTPVFYTYAVALPGLVPLYRCRFPVGRGSANHYLTLSSACDGIAGAVVETALGYVAGGAVCGSTPLYRAGVSALAVNFYTASDAERAAVLAMPGWSDYGVTAYVWTTP